MSKRVKMCLLVPVLGILSLFWEFPAYASGSQQTSDITAQTIMDDSRRYLNATSPSGVTDPMWSDDDLLKWTSNGQRDVVFNARTPETTETILLTSAVSEYAVSQDYYGVDKVVYFDGSGYKSLKRGDMRDFGDMREIGEPNVFYEEAGKLGIMPLPDTTGTTIFAYLVQRPEILTSATSPILTPDIFDMALTYYTVSEAYKKAQKMELAEYYKRAYLFEIERAKAQYYERPKDAEKQQ